MSIATRRARIGHYARIAGFDNSCIAQSKLELRTKPAPDWKEVQRYAHIRPCDGTSWIARMQKMRVVFALGLRRR